jgi:hypothetical protein
MSLKNPVTPPGTDPRTVRLVAQRRNHYATPGPFKRCSRVKMPESEADRIPPFSAEAMTTESPRYNCFIRNGGNAIPKHSYPKAKFSSPTAGHILLWVCNPFRGNSNSYQISQEEAGQI